MLDNLIREAQTEHMTNEAMNIVRTGGGSRTSRRIHLPATEANNFGQIGALCGGVQPWCVGRTDRAATCGKCLAMAAGGQA